MKEYSVQPFEYDEIKVIIFDFDETLYYSPNLQECYINYVKQAILDLSYSPTTKQNVMQELKKHGFTTKDENRVAMSEYCEEYFSVYKPDWDNYKKTKFFEPDYENTTTIDNEVLQKLSKKYRLILVSNEIWENIVNKSQKLNIDLSVFSRVYAPTKAKPRPDPKRDIYRRIINTNLLDGTEIYVVGDRYKVDIKPLLRYGGAGLLVDNTADTTKFLAEKFLGEKISN